MIIVEKGLNNTLKDLLRKGKVEWLSVRDGNESDLIVVSIRMAAEVGPRGMSTGTPQGMSTGTPQGMSTGTSVDSASN
jgi:hypothetical protein